MIRKPVLLACLVLGCLSSSRAVWGDDAELIRQTSQAFTAAFDKGDAAAIAKMWTAGGELVDASGKVYKGRAEIEAAYKEFFAAHPGEKIKVSVDSINLLSEESALEQGTASLESADSSCVESAGKYTAVHVKQDGAWLMAFVHESDAAVSSSASALSDLDWLVGKWSVEEYGATMTINCRWLPNQSFLERSFTVVTPDKQKSSGIQIVGTQAGSVTSWNFNSDGSHAVAVWMPTATGWAIRSSGMLPDGTETHAVNLLSKLDENAYSWQSVQRSVGLESLPNTGEVILKRVVPAKAQTKKK
jgi:uncharacterized protein (TIGR02246 family)